MTCILYREGKGTIEHGIECESTSCEPGHVEGLLNAGWSVNPPGYVTPEPVVVEPEELPLPEAGASPGASSDDLATQIELLTKLDETNQAEITRLGEELAASEANVDSLSAEVVELKVQLASLTTLAADTPNETPEEASTTNPVRLKAKEAGIAGWDTKRIATLENLLSGA